MRFFIFFLKIKIRETSLGKMVIREEWVVDGREEIIERIGRREVWVSLVVRRNSFVFDRRTGKIRRDF